MFRELPNYPEFNPLVLLKCGHISRDLVKWYFPPNVKHVDRFFTWTIWEAVEPAKAQAYYDKVMDDKLAKKPKSNYVGLMLTRKWARELMQHQPIGKLYRTFDSTDVGNSRVKTNFVVVRKPRAG